MVPGFVSGVTVVDVVCVAAAGVASWAGVGKRARLSLRVELVLIGVAPKKRVFAIKTER